MQSRAWIAVGLSFALCASALAQQKWPSRNIEIIIPFSPGSGVDLIGRSLAAAFTEQLRQTAVVLNREGAAGTVGFSNLAAAAPDGHTLAFGPTTPIANAPYLVWVQSVNATRLVVYRRVFQSPRSCVGVD